jgi:hypothetical protein
MAVKTYPYADPAAPLAGWIADKIAVAQITTGDGFAAVNFATAFRNADGVVDLSGVTLRQLRIVTPHHASGHAPVYALDGITNGAEPTPAPIAIPLAAGKTVVFQGFDTNVALAFDEGTTTAGVLTLIALYETT